MVGCPPRVGSPVEGRGTRSGLRAAASPVAAVLILAGVFHFYRGVPGEGVLFVAVGLAVAADAAGWLPSPRSRVFRLPGRDGVIRGCCGWRGGAGDADAARRGGNGCAGGDRGRGARDRVAAAGAARWAFAILR